MLYIDTTTQRVDRIEYDAATGDLGERRPWVTIPDDAGHPDGMTLDAEGCAWVALWGGGCVVRFSPEGVPMSRIDVPAASASSCAFGGPDLDHLFITTAQWPDPATAAARRGRAVRGATRGPREAADRIRGLTGPQGRARSSPAGCV